MTEWLLVRAHLLAGVLSFVRTAGQLDEVARIALIGSLATTKPNPRDADLLVTVRDAADLARLAALGRRLRGQTQQRNCGGEVFLATPAGAYLGRTCPWRACRPGLRLSCDSRHCGRRPYLHDDLRTITLAQAPLATPPIELWPRVAARRPTSRWRCWRRGARLTRRRRHEGEERGMVHPKGAVGLCWPPPDTARRRSQRRRCTDQRKWLQAPISSLRSVASPPS